MLTAFSQASDPFGNALFFQVRAARSRGGLKAQRVSPAPLKVATTFYQVRHVAHPRAASPLGDEAGDPVGRKSTPHSTAPILRGSSSARYPFLA